MSRIIAAFLGLLVILSVILFLFINSSIINVASDFTSGDLPTVIIDAGHGGEDGGTSSADGLLEKSINLSVANKLATMLELSGYKVLLTRTDDEQIGDNSLPTIRQRKISDIKTRLSIAQAYPQALFVSIHQNHYSQAKYRGTQVFYSSKSYKSKFLAQNIQSSFVRMLQPDNEREIKEVGSNIYLLYNCTNTSVMVECGFMSNPEEAELLNTEEYQKKIALSIMCGIISFLEDENGKS